MANPYGSEPGPRNVLRGHRAEVQCLQFFGDALMFAGDASGEVKLWSMEQQRPCYTRQLHSMSAGVMSLCLAGSDTLVSQGRDGLLQAWHVLPDGSLSRDAICSIATGAYTFCKATTFDRATNIAAPSLSHASQHCPGAPMLARQQAQQDISGNAALKQQQQVGDTAAVAAACTSAAATVPSASSPAMHFGFQVGIGSEAAKVAARANSDFLASTENEDSADNAMAGCSWSVLSPGENPNELVVWDVQTGAKRDTLQQHAGVSTHGMAMAAVAYNSAILDVPHILSGYEDGSVAVWDCRRSAVPVAVGSAMHHEALMCLAVMPNGKGAVSGSADDQLCCFRLPGEGDSSAAGNNEVNGVPAQPASCIASLTASRRLMLPVAGVADVAVRLDGRLFASAGWDGKVRLYGTGRAKPALAVLKYHRGQATCLGFSANSSWLASGGQDKTIALWSVYPPLSPPTLR